MSIEVSRALRAGFIGTAVMTAVMYMAPLMGMPEMDMAMILGTMFTTGTAAFIIGMIIHFMMGTVVFPLIYVYLLRDRLSGSATVRGIWFGLIVAGAAMIIGMPMMGFVHPLVISGAMPAPGFLLLGLGALAPVGSIMGHIIYGAILGKLAGGVDSKAATPTV